MRKTKNTNARKRIAASGCMLAFSAAMLGTSTYAWFTMSREVEVTGIKMTASVPEDIQISLGDQTGKIVAGSTPLTLAGSLSLTDDGKVPYDAIKAPDGATNGNSDSILLKNTTDWYNTVDFSQHYVAGKLKPVSSTDGNYLFKTADANEEGKAVERSAQFESVTRADEAGLYRIGSVSGDKFTYNGDSNTSYLDSANLAEGYYIDFPVWFRTSAKASSSVNHTTGYVTSGNLNLGVVASIVQRTATDTDQDLYHAVRVAVLPSGDTNSVAGAMVNTGSPGTIVNTVQGAQDSVVAWYNRYKSSGTGNNKANDTALDAVTRQAVKAPGYLAWNPGTATVAASSIYGWADLVNQAYTAETGESVVAVPLAAANADWGYSQRYIIRVWLEGEDVNCWNETAGQDWDISLKFVKLESTKNASDEDTSATSHAVPADNATGAGDASDGTAVGAPTAKTALTVKLNDGTSDIATIAYNTEKGNYNSTSKLFSVSGTAANTWKGVASIGNAIDKATWSLADGTTFANETDFVNYINKYNGKYAFDDTITLTSSNYVAS